MSDPNSPEWLKTGLEHLWLPYTQMKTAPVPTPVAATEGTHIILQDGRRLIDGCSSWWTACHGYNHPHIIAEVRKQLETMPHIMMGGLANEQAWTLATRLANLLPGDLNRVFLCESGSVSVEVAMKMAIQFWINQGKPTHKTFLNFDHGYHGDTMGAMSVCDVDRGMHQVFKGALVEQHRLPMPVDDETREAFVKFLETHHEELAAVIMEPLVQGAGGLKFHDAETLRFIREKTEVYDVLLILDEIMTGFGRLGSMFACEQAGIVPDLITLSKALTGGTMPLAATISSDKVSEKFITDDPGAALMHGPTYMGNPLGCAAANASLDLFEREPRMAQVAAIHDHFERALTPARNLKGVKDVRCIGAIGVIEVEEMKEIEWLKGEFIRRGLFVRPMSNVIYAAPPFIIEEQELESLTDAMVDVTRDWSHKFN